MGENLCGGLGSPEFGDEETGESILVGDSGEACLGEGCGVVGEVGGAEACEEAEGEVEASDEDSRGKVHEPTGNTEVGDNPERSGSGGWSDASDEGVELGLGEAVE